MSWQVFGLSRQIGFDLVMVQNETKVITVHPEGNIAVFMKFMTIIPTVVQRVDY